MQRFEDSTIDAVIEELESTQKSIPWVDMTRNYTQVRLQVLDWKDFYFNIHCGDPSFDLDHNGDWGASHIEEGEENLEKLAIQLLSDAEDSRAQKAI